jgi:hypothetical protein
MNGSTYQVAVACEGDGRPVSWHDVNVARLTQPLM